MRYFIRRTALLVAALMLLAVPVLAEDNWSGNPTMEPAQQGGKDECLLVAMDCGGRADTFQAKINRIQNEINKGTAVYTNEELRILEKRLEDANRELNEAVQGGA